MALPERLERPRCPACGLDLEPLSKIVRSEPVYWCGFCAREWLEDADAIWYEGGVRDDSEKWKPKADAEE